MSARRCGVSFGVSDGEVFAACDSNNSHNATQHPLYTVRASLAFLRRVNDGTLEPDVFRRTPLDMRAYCKMYGSTRIPLPEKDEHVQVASFGGADCDYGGVRHVAVMIGGG